MVVAKAWLSELRILVGAGTVEPVVGILAFEGAATMARLVSLYRSLSGPAVQRLRSDTMRSQGIAYLNSTDQFFLLCLASAEFMTDLDRAAGAVSRMGLKCSATFPRGFDKLYDHVKSHGISSVELDRFGLGSSRKSVAKMINRMERHVSVTSKLFHELQVLGELESSTRNQFRRNSGPILAQNPGPVDKNKPVFNQFDPLQVQLRDQMNKVDRLKDESLWGKTYDKTVELMARAVITVFAKICQVFSPMVPGLPNKNPNNKTKHSSGPLDRPASKDMPIQRHSAPIITTKATITNTLLRKWSRVLEPPPNSLGAVGLAMRYANVIAMAEKLLTKSYEYDEEEVREELYGMLPVSVRGAVRAKLRECWRREGGEMDGSMAEGWSEAVRGILRWLGPVARDTVRWTEERNMDRRQRFETGPRTLLLQTLHFSDAEKTSAAIVEVLVGLSCMSWYDERRRRSSGGVE